MKNIFVLIKYCLPRLLPISAIAFLCFIHLFVPNHANANTLTATSDGNQLWLTNHQKNSTTVYQLDFRADRKELRKITEFNGTLAKDAITSKPQGAWLIFNDRTLWSVTAAPYQPGLPNSYNSQFISHLPSGLTPLSIAGISYDPQALWMYARIESPKTLATIDNTISEKTEIKNIQATREFRLLKIDHGKIKKIALPHRPQHEPKFKSVWLISPNQNQQVPTLIFADSLHQKLTVYFPDQNKPSWKPPKNYTPEFEHQELQFTMASDQLVMASRSSNRVKDSLNIRLWNLRHDLDTPLAISELRLTNESTASNTKSKTFDITKQTKWRLIAIAGNAPSDIGLGIIAFQNTNNITQLISKSCYLDGSPMENFNNISTPNLSHPLTKPGPLVLLIVLVFSTLILYLFWKRDPTWNQLVLPQGYLICDLSRRLIAGIIDLAPCLWLAMYVHQLTSVELYNLWQLEFIDQWDKLIPIALAIGLYLTHCTLLELFTKRSIGKWIIGLKIVSLDGTTPTTKQILIRNGMMIFELIAYFLFILPMLSPFRQRIGDMVAKTVVVIKKPKDITPNPNN